MGKRPFLPNLGGKLGLAAAGDGGVALLAQNVALLRVHLAGVGPQLVELGGVALADGLDLCGQAGLVLLARRLLVLQHLLKQLLLAVLCLC